MMEMSSSQHQYHSALHESDNRYHTNPDCPWLQNIIRICNCSERRPSTECQGCPVVPTANDSVPRLRG